MLEDNLDALARTITAECRKSMAKAVVNCASLKTWKLRRALPTLIQGYNNEDIGRGVHFGAKALILDEPTAALSVAETRKELNHSTNARERCLAVILISYKVHHVYMLAYSYTVIRQRKNVATYSKSDLSEDDIADLIIGDREV